MAASEVNQDITQESEFMPQRDLEKWLRQPQDLQRYVKDLFLSVYGTAPAEEKVGAVGLIKRGFSYGTE